jgi:preprotein translocase subunit SecE
MRTKSTLVGIFFIGAGLLTAWVLSIAFASLFGALRITDTAILGDRVTLTRLLGFLVGGLIAVGAFMWPKSKTFVGECAEELYKVNWPTWPETRVSTLVVIVTSVIAAMILGVFDTTFNILSNWLATHV